MAIEGFQAFEFKIAEADFFLDQIKKQDSSLPYYFSAFLSATRSITFCLQKHLSYLEDFEVWYQPWRERLESSSLANYFKALRNKNQKEGYNPVAIHISFYDCKQDEEGNIVFIYISMPEIIEDSENYFRLLMELVFDCFKRFGPIVDPDQYYTEENIAKIGKSIEDIEEELGYPRGWTDAFKDNPDSFRIRLNLLLSEIPRSPIDIYFVKYLGKDKYGKLC